MSMIDVVAAHALIDDGSGALVADVRSPVSSKPPASRARSTRPAARSMDN